jgi:hypothetical protein
MDWNKVGALFTIGCFILAGAAFILQVKPLPWSRPNPSVTPRVARGKAVYVLLALGFLSSAITLWRAWNPIIVQKTVTVAEPYAFAWQGDKSPSKHIARKNFEKEKVYLDDISYTDCTFRDVTFVYNGTAPFSLMHDGISGFNITSENPSIGAAIKLMYALNVLSVPLKDQDTGKAPNDIIPLPKKK